MQKILKERRIEWRGVRAIAQDSDRRRALFKLSTVASRRGLTK